MNLSVENVLMIVLVAFALHYLMRNCGCRRVEGVSNRKEGACCDMGECGDGLECKVTAMNSECFNAPGKVWYGRCQKETHYLSDFWGGLMKGGMPTQAWNGHWS